MFRRPDPEDTPSTPSDLSQETIADSHTAPNIAPPLKPFSKKGTHMPNKPATPPNPQNFRTEIPRRVLDIPGAQRKPQSLADTVPNESKLVVGKEIKLSGSISACECLVVEGGVTAEKAEARDLIVSKGGVFNGKANVERAEVSGLFEGDLAASDTVTVKPGGHIKGNVTYVNLVMEKGAVIEGNLTPTSRQAPPMRAKLAEPSQQPTATE
jgi:cytoskeletal protein CcmA (bactofilin family)